MSVYEEVQEETEKILRKCSAEELDKVCRDLSLDELDFKDKTIKIKRRTIAEFLDELSEEEHRREALTTIRDSLPEAKGALVANLLAEAEEKPTPPLDEDSESEDEDIARRRRRKSKEDKAGTKIRKEGKDEDRQRQIEETLTILKALGVGTSTEKVSMFRKDFKISGVIGGTKDNRLDYVSLCSQIVEGRMRGFTQEELAFGVRRAVTPNTELRRYLDSTGPEISLEDILSFVRSSYKEKSATELFQELNKLCQKDGEDSSEFLLRALSLRKRIAVASEVESKIKYDDSLVYSICIHAIRTGLNNHAVRNHMLPFLTESVVVSDNVLMEEIKKASAEENERSSKQKMTKSTQGGNVKVNEIKIAGMQEMIDTVAALGMKMCDMEKDMRSMREGNQRRNENEGQRDRPNPNYQAPRGCENCLRDNLPNCRHCHKCGRSGHLARNCRTRRGDSSNE